MKHHTTLHLVWTRPIEPRPWHRSKVWRNKGLWIAVLLFLLNTILLFGQEPLTFQSCAPWAVRFSPRGGCAEAIVSLLNGAKKSIRVVSYQMSSVVIVKALVDAKKRGVDLIVVLDRKEAEKPYSKAKELRAAGITVLLDGKHKIQHNKVIIVDMETVATGSFNFSNSAETNSELLILLKDRGLAEECLKDWAKHRQHSGAGR